MDPILHHQFFKLGEIREAQQHFEELLVYLFSPGGEQVVEAVHVGSWHQPDDILHSIVRYVFNIFFYLVVVVLEDWHVLDLVLFGILEDQAVTLQEASVHLLELSADHSFLQCSNNFVEELVVCVVVFLCVLGLRYCCC